MAETILRVALGELRTARIHCKSDRCGMIFEVPIERLEDRFRSGKCPACDGQMQQPEKAQNGFVLLKMAVDAFTARSDFVQIEFPVSLLPEPKT